MVGEVDELAGAHPICRLLEEPAHGFCRVGNHEELLGSLIGDIAVGHPACAATALGFVGSASVREAFPDHVELELGQGREHVQLEASHAAPLDVENPRNHGEPNAEAIEDGDETCPIRQLPRKPVDAVHDDPLHLTGLDASEESLEGWPGDGSAAVPFVVELLGDGVPATPGKRPGELDAELTLQLAGRGGDVLAASHDRLARVDRAAGETEAGRVIRQEGDATANCPPKAAGGSALSMCDVFAMGSSKRKAAGETGTLSLRRSRRGGLSALCDGNAGWRAKVGQGMRGFLGRPCSLQVTYVPCISTNAGQTTEVGQGLRGFVGCGPGCSCLPGPPGSNYTPQSEMPAVSSQSQIVVTISETTKKKLERFTASHGLEKVMVVEQALLSFLEATRKLPDEALGFSRLVVADRGFDRVAKLVTNPTEPTEALREVMRGVDG